MYRTHTCGELCASHAGQTVTVSGWVNRRRDHEGVRIKLPEESVVKLLEIDMNAVPFHPLGKPRMREWDQINLVRSKDYNKYKTIFEESIRYLLTQQ